MSNNAIGYRKLIFKRYESGLQNASVRFQRGMPTGIGSPGEGWCVKPTILGGVLGGVLAAPNLLCLLQSDAAPFTRVSHVVSPLGDLLALSIAAVFVRIWLLAPGPLVGLLQGSFRYG